MAFGTVLFLGAVVHHAAELAALDQVVGPVAAVMLDGLPALGLVYAGYWLSGTDLSPDDRWQVFSWCLLGAALFGLIMGLSLLVRATEGRVVSEPLLPLLIGTEAGGIAGVVAGYNVARARTGTRRARSMSDAFQFVNSLMRHYLRNDLVLIRGQADLIEAELDSADVGTELDRTSVIAEKADEAIDRIETADAIARTLTGAHDLERIDLAAITAEMAGKVEAAHDLPVETDLPDRALVAGNAGLRSVVDNLLENAVEHNDADEPRVRVTVDSTQRSVRLAVADNGSGIPDERKEGLFESRPGAPEGGGLSLIRTLVDEYGGTVRVEDNEPRGAVFTVKLPRAGADQQRERAVE